MFFKKRGERPIETDVLVVGTGAAGLAAALMAHDGGARVTLIEKTARVGGTTAVSLQVSSNAAAARATSIQVADRLYLITQQPGP